MIKLVKNPGKVVKEVSERIGQRRSSRDYCIIRQTAKLPAQRRSIAETQLSTKGRSSRQQLLLAASYLLMHRADTKPQLVLEEEDPLVLSLFLNLMLKDIHSNPSSLEPYTEEMAREDDDLLAGVVVD